MYLATTELSTNSLIGVIIIKPRCMWPCCDEEQTIPYIIQSTANNNRRKTCCRRSIHKVQNAINAVQTSDVLLWAESHLRGQRTTNSAISNSRHATRVAEHTVRHDTRVACRLSAADSEDAARHRPTTTTTYITTTTTIRWRR